eukprot:14254857-Ditylum_brightwellii.AAC.1
MIDIGSSSGSTRQKVKKFLLKDGEALVGYYTYEKACELMAEYKEEDKNQIHSKSVYGLVVPRMRSVNSSMSTNDVNFYVKTEDLLREAMEKSLPLKCEGKGNKLHMVPSLNRTFLPDPSMSFHASRYELTDGKTVLNIHVDTKHPDIYDTLYDLLVDMPVMYVSAVKDKRKSAIIDYVRDSVIRSSLQY